MKVLKEWKPSAIINANCHLFINNDPKHTKVLEI